MKVYVVTAKIKVAGKETNLLLRTCAENRSDLEQRLSDNCKKYKFQLIEVLNVTMEMML